MRFMLAATFATVACSAPADDATPLATPAATTLVSLTFDDTHADNFQVGAIAEARGMRATFYVNSGRIGARRAMRLGQLLALQDRGHEIGGHTITHARLTHVPPHVMRREICDDRTALLAAGLDVVTFAYPFSAHDANVRAVVAECGYAAARAVDGLRDPDACPACPPGNPLPPPDVFQIAAPDSIDQHATLATLQAHVIAVEQGGGGWVPLVFHHVCDDCGFLAIPPRVLADFLDWLAARADAGTQVVTVREALGV